jgi:hypothetical protein
LREAVDKTVHRQLLGPAIPEFSQSGLNGIAARVGEGR